MKIPILVKIKPQDNLQMHLQYDDGTEGLLDFSGRSKVGVLKSLSEKSFFEQVKLADGVLHWPNEIEIDGDSLYLELKGMSFDEWKKEQLVNA